MDDDFGDDADFSAALDAAPAAKAVTNSSKVQQPKPQSLPSRSAPTSILVSPRQKGNPILNSIRGIPWEYSDIPADYVLGATTCALFLSLKYHRLHPEYVFTRIKGLQGKYNLRILLTMVDIQNHEDPIKELTKTSLINDVTVILCWSAQEAGRYLELFKSYENASPTSIRAHQSTTYSDKVVDFITVPRSINKTDAVALMSSFGSVRTAVNASPEEVALVSGFGEKKVRQWCGTVRENFRVKRAAKRGITQDDSLPSLTREASRGEVEQDQRTATRLGIASSVPTDFDKSKSSSANASPGNRPVTETGPDADDEVAQLEAGGEAPVRVSNGTENNLTSGISSALERLRREI